MNDTKKNSFMEWSQERKNGLGRAGLNAKNTCLSSNPTDIDLSLLQIFIDMSY